MGKAVRTADRLRAMVQVRLNTLPRQEHLGSPLPLPVAGSVTLTPRDRNGRNWDITRFDNATGYLSQIRMIVDALRDEYDVDGVAG